MALMRRVNLLMIDELVARLRAAGYNDVTAAHHVVFENIDATGTRLTVLAQRAGLTRQSTTELVSTLERNGYLEIRRDSTDGRARLAVLTRAGRHLVRIAMTHISAIEVEWQEKLGRAGLNTSLRASLERALATSETHGRAADL